MRSKARFAINLPFTKGMVENSEMASKTPFIVSPLLTFLAANIAATVNELGVSDTGFKRQGR